MGMDVIHPKHVKPASAVTPVPRPAVKKPAASGVARHAAKPAGGHKPVASSTLMRQSVKKPVAATRKHGQAQGDLSLVKRSETAVLAKKSAGRLDDRRLQKAKRVPKSELIQHFAPLTSDSFVPVQVQPQAAAAPLAAKRPMAAPAPAAKPKTSADLLERALKNATSHEQKSPAKRRRKAGRKTALAGAVLAVAFIGLVSSQEISNVRLHIASAKAGFNVGLPDYKPAGFSLGQLNYSPGSAATTFKSNSDQRTYTITQKTSDWDSQSLRDNFVVSQDKNYQTADAGGRTVYVYGNGNATWVNGGIWYVVQSDGSLTSQQLTQLAGSI